MAADKLDVIRKLLARAERAGTPEEAAACTDKAVALMARHGVDAALLAAAEPGTDDIGVTRHRIEDPYSAGKARLLGWIGAALRCRCVLLAAAGGGRVREVEVLGYRSDRERVAVLWTSLLVQATAQLVRVRPPVPWESVAAYRRSWLHGFSTEVHRRLLEAEQHAERAAETGSGPDSAPGAALVLADRRGRVQRAWDQAYGHLRTARRSSLSGSGFGEGAVAGARADLGARRVGARGAVGDGAA
jgi:hypothetical protein